jgi:hypothetical protein
MVASTFTQFADILKSQLIIRYFLKPGSSSATESLDVEIICGQQENLVPQIDTNKRPLSSLIHMRTAVSIGLTYRLLDPRIHVWTESDAAMKALGKILSDWNDASDAVTWRKEWMRPEPFIGIIRYGEETFRKADREAHLFSFYHGTLVQCITSYYEELTRKEHRCQQAFPHTFPLRTLSNRFVTFVSQTRRTEVAKMIGGAEILPD